jgi:hypothetical protein
MKNNISITFFFLIFINMGSLWSQKKYTVSGTLTDGTNGETMIGAAVLIKEKKGVGTTCNPQGFYSLTLPEGSYTLQIQFIGYQQIEKQIVLDKNIVLDFKLNPNSIAMKECSR